MKKIFTILILTLTSFTLAQNKNVPSKEKKETTTADSKKEKKEAFTAEDLKELEKSEEKERKLYTTIAKYIQKTYVEPSEKKIPKLETKVNKLQKAINVTQSKKLKEKYEKDLIEVKAELEVEKMWKIYHQAYLIQNISFEKGDGVKYEKAQQILRKIKKRYFALKAQYLVPPEIEFKKKYAAQVKKFIETN